MHEYKRILAIGDIHGQYDKLLDLYEKIEFNPAEDLLVFLGDYIDRGPAPLEVLDWLMEREGAPNIVMLRGNHDQMMLDYYVDKEEQREWGWKVPEESWRESWRRNGGDVTARCLAEKAKTCSPNEFANYKRGFLDFLGNLPLAHTVEAGGKTFFFCHAGIDPDKPLEEQTPDDLMWLVKCFEFHRNYRGETVVVAGHTPVIHIRRMAFRMEPVNEPIIEPVIDNNKKNMILVDTGSGKGGLLSCVDVLSGDFWRSYCTGK